MFHPRPSFLALALLLSGLALGACGSSSPSTSGTAGTSGSAGAGGNNTAGVTGGDQDAAAPTGCPKSALTVLFSPMYSAFDGVHTFQVPAVINGIDPNAVTIEWSASDPSMVALEPDPTTGGVMITTQKAGTVSIIASAGSLCGASLLTITDATPDDWMAGSARYNEGVVITRLPGGMMRPPRDAGADAADAAAATDAGIEAACTSCHGDTASAGPFKTVQHTPEQTGGFSDEDLINIFEHGMVPKGGYFDTSIVPYAFWQGFHKWSVGDSEKGLVVYLRSLAPAAQTGASNFGGRFDGGVRDGGFLRDGGGGMRRDAAGDAQGN
jgi:hypothetical protein